MLECCLLYPELIAGVSGMAHGHGLWVQGVDLKEVAGCQLLKPVLCFAWFYQSSFFSYLGDSYCNTTDMAYSNCSSDDTQWQGYIAVNIVQFYLFAILTQNQIPLNYTLDFPVLLHHPRSAPRSLRKSSAADGFAFA